MVVWIDAGAVFWCFEGYVNVHEWACPWCAFVIGHFTLWTPLAFFAESGYTTTTTTTTHTHTHTHRERDTHAHIHT